MKKSVKKRFKLSMEIPILAGAVAFTVAGIALAGQGKSFFSNTNPTYSTDGIADIPLWNMADADRDTESLITPMFHLPAVAASSRMLSDDSAKHLRTKSTYLPTPNLSVALGNWVSMGQMVGGFGYAPNESFSDGSSSGNHGWISGGGSDWKPKDRTGGGIGPAFCFGFCGGFGGEFSSGGNSGGGGLGGGGLGNSGDLSNALVMQFGNAYGPSTWTLNTTGNLTYSVAAVPEPNEWLMMLFGLGLVGYITSLRKHGFTVAS